MDAIVKPINRLLDRLGLPSLRVLTCILTTSALSVFSTYYFGIVNVAEPVFRTFLDDYFSKVHKWNGVGPAPSNFR
jgi:hypothetical protein